MKILNMYGGRINGFSATIANHFLDVSRKLGAEIESFTLTEANVTNRKKCQSCKTTSVGCVIRDDVFKVFQSLIQAEILVFSTGIHSGEVSRDIRFFENRLYSFMKPDFETNSDPSRLPPGKKLLYIQTQTADEDCYVPIYQCYRNLFFQLRFTLFMPTTSPPLLIC